MYFIILSLVFFLSCLYFIRNRNKKISEISEPLHKNKFIFFPHSNADKSINNKETISILTYNILVQKYVKSKKLHYKFRSTLSLNSRMNKILNEINSLDSDIVCLQEVVKENLDKYLTVGLKDYNIYSAENTGSNFLNLIGFKKNKFKFIQQKSLNLDFSKFEFIDNYLFGNRGIFKLVLERKDRYFVIYNVHFPWRPQFEYHKCVITNFIFEDILNEHYNSNCNIFIAGDFNSLPESNVLKLFYNDFNRSLFIDEKFLKNQFLVENFEEMLNNSKKIHSFFKLKSVYDNYKSNLNEIDAIQVSQTKEFYVKNHPQFTNYTEYFCGNIDYIFYSKQLHPVKILQLPSITEAKQEIFFPSTKYPSDHIKLYSEFFFA